MSGSSKQNITPGFNKVGIFNLLIVYLVWGSTYLAIRVAVRPGAGFTPFILGAMRVLVAGSILLILGALSHKRLRLTYKEFLTLSGSGTLLWLGCNGLVMLGEQHADSGVTALIIASTPMWTAVIDAAWSRKMPSLLLIASLLIGASGIVILSMPLILSGLKADFLSVVVLVSGSLCWACGTVIQTKNPTELAPGVSSGYQQIFGGIGFITVAFLLREPLPHPIPEAWAALLYLMVFGSLIAFTSYVQVLTQLPMNIVMTYGYVNPIIAVILGWLILGENFSPWTVAGAALILLGVSGVFRANTRKGTSKSLAV
jgi:drug/metabolite transporter (DMT)-like permease